MSEEAKARESKKFIPLKEMLSGDTEIDYDGLSKMSFYRIGIKSNTALDLCERTSDIHNAARLRLVVNPVPNDLRKGVVLEGKRIVELLKKEEGSGAHIDATENSQTAVCTITITKKEGKNEQSKK